MLLNVNFTMGNLNHLPKEKVSFLTGYHQHKQNNNTTSRLIIQSKEYNFPFLQVNLNIGISILSELLQSELVMLFRYQNLVGIYSVSAEMIIMDGFL